MHRASIARDKRPSSIPAFRRWSATVSPPSPPRRGFVRIGPPYEPGSITLGRLPVAGRPGAVACGHQEAAEIGLDTIRQGGNAVDAAIAGAFASFVVEPQMCGIGGHGRMS